MTTFGQRLTQLSKVRVVVINFYVWASKFCVWNDINEFHVVYIRRYIVLQSEKISSRSSSSSTRSNRHSASRQIWQCSECSSNTTKEEEEEEEEKLVFPFFFHKSLAREKERKKERNRSLLFSAGNTTDSSSYKCPFVRSTCVRVCVRACVRASVRLVILARSTWESIQQCMY